MNNLALDDSNIVQLEVINGTNKKKEVKRTLDGQIKKTKSNKKSGVSSEVYPFYTEEIEKMMDVLNNKIENASTDAKKKQTEKNKLLFVVGINIGLRASDIRTLKWSFFFDDDMEWRDFYTIMPQKTSKNRKYVKLFFNMAIHNVVDRYIALYPIEDLDDYVFTARGNTPITVQTIWNLLKDTAREAGIKKNIGTHSMRKTFGYHAWHGAEDKYKALIILQNCFNHSSTIITQKYIGIMQEEIRDMFGGLNLGYTSEELAENLNVTDEDDMIDINVD